jgi:tripartite-type tricarboxylate transporter receptor subunit TctC
MKSMLLALAAIVLFAIGNPAAAAAAWPAKPVRIVVPWSAGGTTDAVSRFVAADLTKRFGQQVLIDNRAGAGGILGMLIAEQSPPDGHNFMITSTGYGYLISPSKARGVDLVKSFAPVSLLGFTDAALVVHPTLPVKSVKELIALAKARPGQLNYGSSGIGGFPHLSTELFKLKTGIDIVHVPFKSSAQELADLIAGNTELVVGTLASKLGPIHAGRLRILAVGGSKRNPVLPDVPTISEAGVPGYETYIWYGMFAPRNTPATIVSQMHEAVQSVLHAPDMAKKLSDQGVWSQKMTSAEFAKLMAAEQEKWSQVIKAAGIKDE